MTKHKDIKRWLEGQVLRSGGAGALREQVPRMPTDPEVSQLQDQLDETVRRDMTTSDEVLAEVGKREDVAVDVAG